MGVPGETRECLERIRQNLGDVRGERGRAGGGLGSGERRDAEGGKVAANDAEVLGRRCARTISEETLVRAPPARSGEGGRGMMSATRTRPRRWEKRTGERDGNARGVGGGTNPGCAASSSSYIASGRREAPPHARGARAKPLPAAVNTSRKSRDGAAGHDVRLEIKFQSRRVSYSSSR